MTYTRKDVEGLIRIADTMHPEAESAKMARDLLASHDRLAEALKNAGDNLKNIEEYWNRDCNTDAMRDACHHNIEAAGVAHEAIEQALAGAKQWRG